MDIIGIIKRRETWLALAAVVFAITQGLGLPLSEESVTAVVIALIGLLTAIVFEDALTGYAGNLLALLRSRKFRLMLVPILLSILNDGLGLGLSEQVILELLTIFGVLTGGIAVKDGVAAVKARAAA